MKIDYLAADLTAFKPSWINGEGGSGEFFPSFCLPWFPGEDPLVGVAAQIHRRGSELEGIQRESCFDPDNRSRRHWAEGWLALGAHPDSIEKAKDYLEWQPPGEKHRCAAVFPLAIRLVLEQVRGSAKNLGLVVPAGLGPGPREQILDVVAGSYEIVQFFPRPIAIALDWCLSDQGREHLETTQASPGEKSGTLLIVSGAADIWEVALVPLRLEQVSEGLQLCPVHDRTQLFSETRVLGLPWHLSKTEDMEQGLLDTLCQSSDAAQGAPDPTRYGQAVKWLRDGLLAWPDCQEFLPAGGSLEKVLQAAMQDEVNGPLVAILFSGPWETGIPLPHWLEGRLNNLGVTDLDLGQGSPVRGAAEGIRRLCLEHVPYYEALPPLQLLYRGRNKYEDPVNAWQDLLVDAEVPAGQEYRSPRPITGFALPSGQLPRIQLYIRALRRGEEKLGLMEVRSEASLRHAQEVKIVARVRPGQGLAVVDVASVEQGVFRARLREDHVASVGELPHPEYGWPPGSAYVVSHPLMAIPARASLDHTADLVSRGKINSDTFRLSRELINQWRLPSQEDVALGTLEYPRDEIEETFVYLGVFPSDSVAADPSVESVLERFDQLLPDAFDSSHEWKTKNAILWFSSWLYARCPQQLLSRVRDLMTMEHEIPASALACAGNCFRDDSDFSLFFHCFELAITENNAVAQYWIRAYRNMARFRPRALMVEVLTNHQQSVILEWYLDVFEKAVGRLRRFPRDRDFLECAYLAPHMLKRRRFDRDFLDPESPIGMRFSSVLAEAAKSTRNQKHRTNAQSALAFLSRKANFATLQKLAALK
mgnify:CR=1 FL=1